MHLARTHKRFLTWLPLALAALSGCKSVQAERVAFMQMRAAGDRLLIVGHTPDELTGEQLVGRVALMDTKGVIHRKLDERTVFSIEGVTPDLIWITRKTATKDLSANAIDTLAPKPAVAKAIAAHPVLSTTYDVLGTHESKAVVQGANGRSYTIDGAGTIETLAAGAAVEKPGATEAGKRDAVRLRLESIPKKGTDRDVQIHATLDNASAFKDSAAVLGEDSSDLLVHSTRFAAGSVSTHITRVAPSGELIWSSALAELAAPIAVTDAETKLVALTLLDDAAWLLIRASKMSRQQQTDYYEVEHRLVRLNPDSGKAAESHTVKNQP